MGGLDAANTGFGTAQGAATAATRYDPRFVNSPTSPDNVAAQSFLSRDIKSYMDPNIENVVNTTLGGFDQNSQRQINDLSDRARGAGAWGGSRFGVEDAVLRAEQGRQRAATEAGLRQTAFTDASGRIMADNATALQAAMANQGAGLTTNAQRLTAEQANQAAAAEAERIRLQGGGLAASTGTAASTAANQGGLLTSNMGATARGVSQAGRDASYEEFMRSVNYPTEGLNLQLAALGMTPTSKTTTGQSTAMPSTTQPNPWMVGIGAATTLAPLMFSDREAKKNVVRLGKVPGTNLNTYQFQYKKGFMGQELPPQVGLMADDVRKKVGPAPIMKQITPTGKKIDAVHVPMAIAGAARKPRADRGVMRGPYMPRVGISRPFMAA
jgi:hypothetical protein